MVAGLLIGHFAVGAVGHFEGHRDGLAVHGLVQFAEVDSGGMASGCVLLVTEGAAVSHHVEEAIGLVASSEERTRAAWVGG